MPSSTVRTLAEFGKTPFADLPEEVVLESKRLILDTIGCSLSGVGEPKGRIAAEFGDILSGGMGLGEATIIGAPKKASVFGASFANSESAGALDFDAALPPGHVAPLVIPVALAVGEAARSTGADLLTVVALGHESSFRIATAMDGLRDIKDGSVSTAQVSGYSSIIFGTTLAGGILKGLSTDELTNALAIAACSSPVNSRSPWTQHIPSSTVKYLLHGAVTQAALTAVYLAELGHIGDLDILDDAHFGYPAFMGSSRWDIETITGGLGEEWRFPAAQIYKLYPHCRIVHGLFDALDEIVRSHDLAPDEITQIRAWGEAMGVEPIYQNRSIKHVVDAQFSMAHGLAVAAHRIPPGPAWQREDVVFSPSVLGLMQRIEVGVHPEFAARLAEHPASRPSKIEVEARGTVFTAERLYARGGRSPDPTTYLSTDELVEKFYTNAESVISADSAKRVVDAVLSLETVTDARQVMRHLQNDAKTSDPRQGSPTTWV
jgi:2-methylcitrate dehydratase PrpD